MIPKFTNKFKARIRASNSDIFKSNMKEDRSKGIDGHSPSSERLVALREKVLKDYGVDSLSQLSINFRGVVMQEDEEYGNKVWDKHFGNLRTILKNQKKNINYDYIS